MKKTKAQYLKAANEYIKTIKHHPDVIGIVIAGGFLKGMIHKNSDVDIWVILKEECDYTERGVVWVDDIEVEYFMNPPRLIRRQFEREILRPFSATILTNGIIAHQTSKEVEHLIKEAQLHLNAKLPPMGDSGKKLAKHKLNDRYKDLEDLIIEGEFFGAQLMKHEFVTYCIDLFFKTHRIKKEKIKRIKPLMDFVDSKFTAHIDACLTSDIEDIESALMLKSYLEECMGGSNPKNWKIKGKAKR